jgi:DNA (cytosine-5)-methyltransferase 1
MLVRRGLAVVLGDLASLGYDARWCVLGADDVGAPHIRKRIWIVANASQHFGNERGAESAGQQRKARTADGGEVLDDAQCTGLEGHRGVPGNPQKPELGDNGASDAPVANAEGSESGEQTERKGRQDSGRGSGDCRRPAETRADVGNANGERGRPGAGGHDGAQACYSGATEDASWWGIEPDVGRVANGVAARVDRLKCIGNGQVPAVAAAAWRILSARLIQKAGSERMCPR